ncbi:MAG: DUF5050 domain-containing protein [Spirochaetales bacterium]|nr:DUF5050 domain-containing protein [Spirochaetales bacterium]
MKPVRSILGLAGLVLILALLVGSCTPWNPLAGAGIGELKIYWVGDSVIGSADLDGGNVTEVYRDSGMPSYSGIAVDPVNGQLYWSETTVAPGTLYRAALDGTGKETVASIYAVALAVDPYEGKIYFTSGMEISRMNLDGSGAENVLLGGMSISDLELDLVNGRIYWCDEMVIRSSLLTNPLSAQTVYNADPGNVDRIALDVVGGMLYYSEGLASDTIRKVSVSGGTATSVYSPGGVGVGGLDVDPSAGRVYWSVPSASTGVQIYSVGTDGSGYQSIIDTSTDEARRIALYLWP